MGLDCSSPCISVQNVLTFNMGPKYNHIFKNGKYMYLTVFSYVSYQQIKENLMKRRSPMVLEGEVCTSAHSMADHGVNS